MSPPKSTSEDFRWWRFNAIIALRLLDEGVLHKLAANPSYLLHCVHHHRPNMNHRLAYLLFNTAIIIGDLTAPVFADPSVPQGSSLVGYGGSKVSKNSKSGKAASSAVNIKPFKCTNQCIDAKVGLDNSTKLLTDAIVECDAQEEGQEWIIHREGENIVRMESAVYPGQCIAVEHDHYVRNATTGEIQVVGFQELLLGAMLFM